MRFLIFFIIFFFINLKLCYMLHMDIVGTRIHFLCLTGSCLNFSIPITLKILFLIFTIIYIIFGLSVSSSSFNLATLIILFAFKSIFHSIFTNYVQVFTKFFPLKFFNNFDSLIAKVYALWFNFLTMYIHYYFQQLISLNFHKIHRFQSLCFSQSEPLKFHTVSRGAF